MAKSMKKSMKKKSAMKKSGMKKAMKKNPSISQPLRGGGEKRWVSQRPIISRGAKAERLAQHQLCAVSNRYRYFCFTPHYNGKGF